MVMSSTPKPVDMEHLARYTGGDATLNAEVLKLFDDQITQMVGQLGAIMDARDARRWREVTHTIKGAARGVGAFGMGEAAAVAEPIDPGLHRNAAELAIKVLKVRGEAVQNFIRSYLAA
jgi:HPt (histidine-containing phosphotransfer) domain-containing protein